MQPNVVYRLAKPMGGLSTQINLLQPRGLIATHCQSVIYQQRGVAMCQVSVEIEPREQSYQSEVPQKKNALDLLSLNQNFVSIVDWCFQLTQQHGLEATGELELKQTIAQKQGHVIATHGRLSAGQ
jgi:hypothetical protein